MEELGGLRYLAFHHLHLLANAAARLLQHQLQIENSGFHIAERLAEIVNQGAEDLVRGYTHNAIGGQGSV
jgi:hypothetical protein